MMGYSICGRVQVIALDGEAWQDLWQWSPAEAGELVQRFQSG